MFIKIALLVFMLARRFQKALIIKIYIFVLYE